MFKTMIVDDLDFFTEEIRSLNVWGDKSGFTVEAVAANGMDALHKLHATQPMDLLITDIRMPVMDGLELAKIALTRELCQCVILVSQFKEFELARQGLKNGAFYYLVKPVNKEELHTVLRQAAAYINEKKSNQRILKCYHDIHKADRDCFPAESFNELIKDINGETENAALIADKMLEKTYMDSGNDLLKTAFIYNQVLTKLIENLRAGYPWIPLISTLLSDISVDFSIFGDFSALKSSYVKIISNVVSLIRRYELGIGDSAIIRNACKIILTNVDSQLNLEKLSQKLFISRSYLSALFHNKTNMKFTEYFTHVKMERAKILLGDPSLKNYSIASRLGYEDEYFNKVFKHLTGLTPGSYRRKHYIM